MSFVQSVLSDLTLVLSLLGAGFLLRLGMFGFDCWRDILSVHFQKKKP